MAGNIDATKGTKQTSCHHQLLIHTRALGNKQTSWGRLEKKYRTNETLYLPSHNPELHEYSSNIEFHLGQLRRISTMELPFYATSLIPYTPFMSEWA
jgi:hypothetical protein